MLLEEDLTRAEEDARRKAVLTAGLEQHPHDYFLLHRLIVMQGALQGGDEALETARQARKQHLDEPVYDLIYAEALVGRDTPEAIRRLEALPRPPNCWARKLDALLMYRAALRTRPSKPPAGMEDSVAENAARLWKELGGTAAGQALLEETKIQEVSGSRWERPEKPLPPFTLSDLEGRTWKLADLKGKAALVNLWATWCGPCRAELPEFQKLYTKLKDRPDTVVLSFNLDQDLGQVAPFMKENNFTFPVLLASEFVHDHLPGIAIPQNWFLDAAGRHRRTQVGFAGEPGWQATMLAKLDEVLASAAP